MERLMTTINREFQTKVHELTALAYRQSIPCPPLVALNDWMSRQPTDGAVSAAARPAANEAAPAGGPGSFDDAALSAVRSSPNGVGIDDLAAILKPYGKPKNQVGAALGRLKRAGRIRERGELWFIKAAAPRGRPATAGKAGSVDKRTKQRRTRRVDAAKGNGAATGAPAEGQPQAAAAPAS
jgi:hypothetical protein